MIGQDAAVAACARAAEAHATAGAPWPRAVHLTIRGLINRLAAARGLEPPLADPRTPAAEAALDALGPLDEWHVFDLGEIHQRLLELTPVTDEEGAVTTRRRDLGQRAQQGAWYTPSEAARAMCRLSLGPVLEQLAQDSDPGVMFDVLSIDPACGAGVMLIEAARFIAARVAARVSGEDPPPAAHVRAALPVVMTECVFGIDIDPAAVDMAKAALWLEIGGVRPFSFMDRNVIVGDALAHEDAVPPAFAERRGELPRAP